MDKLDIVHRTPPHDRSFNSLPTRLFPQYSPDLRNESDVLSSTTSILASSPELASIHNIVNKRSTNLLDNLIDNDFKSWRGHSSTVDPPPIRTRRFSPYNCYDGENTTTWQHSSTLTYPYLIIHCRPSQHDQRRSNNWNHLWYLAVHHLNPGGGDVHPKLVEGTEQQYIAGYSRIHMSGIQYFEVSKGDRTMKLACFGNT